MYTVCWWRQILAKTHNSPNIIALQNLLIYSIVSNKGNVLKLNFVFCLGGADFLVPVPEETIEMLDSHVERPSPAEAEYEDMFDGLRDNNTHPKTVHEAALLYAYIKDALSNARN